MPNLAASIEDHEPGRLALVDGDDRLTYGELRARVAATRAALAARGIGPDSRVAVLAGTEPLFVIGAYAVLGLGAIVAPVNPSSPPIELERKLGAVSPDLLLLGDAGRWALDHTDTISTAMLDLATIDAGPDAADAPLVGRDGDDLAFLMLTSGVSSDAKVAMLSHGNLLWSQDVLIDRPGLTLTGDDIALGVLPFAHIFGLNAVLLPVLRLGGTVVLQRRFDAAVSLELIRRHGVTLVGGAPPMWQRWAEIEGPDDALASVRSAGSGAAALPADVFTAIRDRYGVEIAEGYGLTETSPVVTLSPRGQVKPTSVGQPAAGVEVVLAESDGTPVDVGDSGEIVVRSPGVFKGYLDAEDLTSAVLTDDGWFWTGDVGVFDDDGYLYIVDRLKDVIIVSGFNVYPSEVESALMEHPDVNGAVVVGTPHGETGEAVVAHVSGPVTVDDLNDFVCTRLSRYKCPSEYHLVDELPVAPTGKLIRRELR